jgi:excisionase family DNA binding protein
MRETDTDQMVYRPSEAAKLLAISERKLDELIAKREIKSFKVGKSRRITREAITAFIRRAESAAR